MKILLSFEEIIENKPYREILRVFLILILKKRRKKIFNNYYKKGT